MRNSHKRHKKHKRRKRDFTGRIGTTEPAATSFKGTTKAQRDLPKAPAVAKAMADRQEKKEVLQEAREDREN